MANLSIVANASPTPAIVGETLTYTLTVANLGPSNAPSVVVSDTIPAGTSFVSATPSQGTASFAAGVVTANLGTLSNGASATIAIAVTPNSAGSKVNSATVSAASADLDLSNNSATTIVTVNNPVADLAVSATAAPEPAFVSSNVTFSIVITNRGPNHADSVRVTQPARFRILLRLGYELAGQLLVFQRRDHLRLRHPARERQRDRNHRENPALAQAGLGEAYWMKYEATHEESWVERAIAACDRALILDPQHSQVHLSLGIVYHGTGKLERAIEEFKNVIERQPLSDDAHRWLGRCYMERDELDLAISHFQEAIKIRGGYWENYTRLGICYYTLGRYHDAAEQFRMLISIQPDNYHGYNNLGAMYYLLGRYEDAIAMHLRAIEIHPAAKAYSNLGSNYFYLERYDEAVAAYRDAIKLDSADDILYRNLGDALLRSGKEAEAAAQFERAISLIQDALNTNPSSAELAGRLAVCLAKVNREDEATNSIERAIALEPHNTMLMYKRAAVLSLVGHTEKAAGYLREALEHGYSQSEALRDPDLESIRSRAEYQSLFTKSDLSSKE